MPRYRDFQIGTLPKLAGAALEGAHQPDLRAPEELAGGCGRRSTQLGGDHVPGRLGEAAQHDGLAHRVRQLRDALVQDARQLGSRDLVHDRRTLRHQLHREAVAVVARAQPLERQVAGGITLQSAVVLGQVVDLILDQLGEPIDQGRVFARHEVLQGLQGAQERLLNDVLGILEVLQPPPHARAYDAEHARVVAREQLFDGAAVAALGARDELERIRGGGHGAATCPKGGHAAIFEPGMSSADSQAEKVFARFLAARDAGAEIPFEAIVRRHPGLADDLLALHGRWQRFDGVFRSLAGREGRGGPGEHEAELLGRLEQRQAGPGRYELHEEVGRGGMGIVRRVHDPDLRRDLAIKSVRPREDEDPTDRARRAARFLEEAQITGQLHHPGVVPVHELGLDADGNVYYTMPLIEGEDLGAVFERVWKGAADWTVPRALTLLLRVCETMTYAHARGVVHRDLKPANVMVGEFGEVYVVDWGLAGFLGTAEHDAPSTNAAAIHTDRREDVRDGSGALHTQVIGTPAYMAPEQALGQPADVRSDVYAVGAMLYTLLARREPFAEQLRGRRGAEALEAIRAGSPQSLARIPSAVDAELQAIAERAMARDPSQRYGDMAALAADLRAYAEGRVVQAHATGAWVEFRKWVGRNRATATALLLLCSSLALGLLASAALFLRAQHSEELARLEKERVLRLSDLKRHEDLTAAAEHLWPAHPENERALRDWLAQARELVSRLPVHRETLAALRESAVPSGDTWSFANTEDQWHHDNLAELVAAVDRLAGPAGTLHDIEQRLEFAMTVVANSTQGPQAADAWARAVAAIADEDASPAYGGLVLQPQLGLLPIGRDPDSGLWEFAHLQTGEPAARGADGRLSVAPNTGLVFALLPAGTVVVGAQATDPQGANYSPGAFDNERPVHAVPLDPFFISKYEMTQAQWERIDRANPSTHKPSTAEGSELAIGPTHPVETISRSAAERLVRALGLELPSEAQWEYAARAGHSTPWWVGDDPRELQGAANLADLTVTRMGRQWPQVERWLDDGWLRHAPVDTLRPNPFGLHHMLGNVWEWCRDDFAAYSEPARPGDGLREAPGELSVGRGGGYVNNAAYARAAIRDARPDAAHPLFGVRPVRPLVRANR